MSWINEVDSEFASGSSMKRRRYWEGFVSGTNRGRAFAVISGKEQAIKASVLLLDQVLGPTTIQFTGARNEDKIRLHLVRFKPSFRFAPLDGSLDLDIENDGKTARGRWSTDIATSGDAIFRRATWFQVRLPIRKLASGIRFQWYRWFPMAYCVGLVTLAVFALLQQITVAWQPFLLLLIPAPLLFQRHLVSLIQGLRVKKAGPIEFETQKPVEQVFSAVVAAIPGLVEEHLAFRDLDQLFVPRTKLLLLRLAQEGELSLNKFEQLALEVGVPKDNLNNTTIALLSSGCASFSADRISITVRGRDYARHLIPQGARPAEGGSNP